MRRFGRKHLRLCALLGSSALSVIVTVGVSAHKQRAQVITNANAPAVTGPPARAAQASPALPFFLSAPPTRDKTAARPLASSAPVIVGPAISWSQTYGPSPDPTVKAVAYAPDGQTVATAHGDRAAHIWRAADGALLRTFTNPGYSCSGGATGVAYTPDSQFVFVADSCATRLLNIADGTLVRKLSGGGRIAISPDGLYLAATSQTTYRSRVIKLLRIADNNVMWSMTGGGNSVAFAPDGTLASIGRDGIEFWNVADGTKLRTIAGPINTIAFSPDSQLVAGAGQSGGEYPYDSTLAWYRVSDGTLVRRLTRTGDVSLLRFTPDGQYLMSGGADGDYNIANSYGTSTNTIRIWRLSDGLAFKTYDLGTEYPSFAGLAVAPDTQSFAYAIGATTYHAAFPAPTQCTYTITPTSTTVERDGATATIAIDTQPGCAWTARSRVDWLSITNNAAGTGPGTTTYTVAPYADYVVPGAPYYIHGIFIVADQTFAVHQNIAPPGPGHFKIYGQVADSACLAGIPDVTVTLSGASTAVVTTNAAGSFSFDNLLGGQNYTVTLAKDGYTFSPASRTINNLSYDQDLPFNTATNPHPLPFVRGRIATTDGTGISGLQLQLTGGTYPRTDYSYTNGNFAFNCLDAGYTYTLTPTSTTFNFTPATRTFADLATGQTGDFIATPKNITISGHVMTNGQPLAGALLKLVNDGQVTTAPTDSAGFYTFTVSAPGYHDLFAAKDGYTFTPQVVNLHDPTSDQTLDFTAQPATAAIEGYVKTNDDHLIAGATVQLTGAQTGTTQTDANGRFIFNNLAPFSDYTVTVAKQGWTFRPASRTFSYIAGLVGNIFYGTLAATDGNCVTALVPDNADFPAGGGTLTASITAPAGCTWTATSDAAWLVVTRGYDSGTGEHLFAASVATNNDAAPRTGTINIGGHTLTVTQRAAAAPDIAWLSGGQAGGNGGASFSPDKQLLATASDGTIKLWRYSDGQLLHTIGSFVTGIGALQFSPDGQYLAVAGQWLPGASDYSATIKLYRVADHALVREFNTGAIYDARSLAFAPDGALLYVGTSQANVQVWNVATGTLVRRMGPFGVRAIALSPDGALVAAAGDDYWSQLPSVRVWRTSDGAVVQTFTNLNLISSAITFAPDGQTLAAGDWGGIYSAGGAVYLWRTADWSLLHKLQAPRDASIGTLAFSPNSELIASAGTDAGCSVCPNNVYLWRVADGALVNTFPAHPGTVFSLNFVDDTTLLTRGGEALARIFHVPDGTLARTIGAQRAFVNAVAFAPDSQSFVATGADDAQASVFGAELFRAADGVPLRTFLGHTDIVNTVAFAPDGQMFATGSGSEPPDTRDTRISLWQPDTGANLRNLAGHAGGTLSVAFAPTSGLLASGGRDNKIKIWNATDGTLVNTLSGHSNYVQQVAFAPDGSLLASASGDATIKLWRTADWTLARTINGNGYPVNSVSFSPDGQTLAAAFSNNGPNLQLYRASDGALLHTFSGDSSSGMGQVAFAPDGQTLVSTSRGYAPAIWFWNIADGQLVRVYEQETGWRYAPAIALSPDGTLLGIGRYDQTVEVAHYPAAGTNCALSMTPQSQTVSAAGGAFNVSVNAAQGCAWTAASGDAWLSVTTGASGAGAGTINYTVAANTTLAARTGALTIAGQTFTVTQSGAANFSVHGHVTDAEGNGLAGATITLGGAQTDQRTTDANGDYTFTNLAGGANYTLNAALAGCTFTPATQTVAALNADMNVDFAVMPDAPGQLLISELRLRGPAGAHDEFIELYNNTEQPLTIATSDDSAGWSLVTLNAAAPALVCLLPNGTTIPARGHYLIANDTAGDGYSLSATPDQTYTDDIGDDHALALFRTAAPEHLTLAYRIDAVTFAGQAGNTAPSFTEGAGLAAVGANVAAGEQYSYARKLTTGVPQDTGDNANDFVLLSTTGTVGGAPVVLGAPGPENMASPIQRNAQIKASLIDQSVASTAAPNRVRDLAPVTNGALGTLTIRRKFTNKTGAPLSVLRFRIVDITTLHTPNAGGGAQADLRALAAGDVTVTTGTGTPVLVKGTMLEQAGQGQGGGLHSALTVALGGLLAPNASVNVQFVLGVEAGGSFRFIVNVEGLGVSQTEMPQRKLNAAARPQ